MSSPAGEPTGASGHTPVTVGHTPKHSTQDAPRPSLHPVLRFLREIGIVVVLALFLSLLLKTFLVQAFQIPSSSMENTLAVGDRVMVNKLQPNVVGLSRGDVVVFADPGNWLPSGPPPSHGPLQQALIFLGLQADDSNNHLIKRVVGLPGDRIECTAPDAQVKINGVSIDESAYLHTGSRPCGMQFDVTVPPDSLWVMGDNRDNSADSRYNRNTNGGFVPLGNVVGKTFVIVWPFNHLRTVSPHNEVFAQVPSPS